LRTVVDKHGREWSVWAVTPQQDAGIGVRQEFAAGWLAFRFAEQRLRLSPIPPGWEAMSDPELRACLGRARHVGPAQTLPRVNRGLP
jgi:hypothetical protein